MAQIVLSLIWTRGCVLDTQNRPLFKNFSKKFFQAQKAACFGGEANGNVSLSYSIFSLIFSTL